MNTVFCGKMEAENHREVCMEVVLLVRDAFGDLLSLCHTWDEAEVEVSHWKTEGMEAVVNRGVIHDAEVFSHRRTSAFPDVYEIRNASGESFLCRAMNEASALIEACFSGFNANAILWIRKYDEEVLWEHHSVAPGEETRELTQPARNILRRLNENNKELCALALEYVNDVEDEEELLELEISMNTPVGNPFAEDCPQPGKHYIPVERQTAEGIRQNARCVWYDWLFLESTDPSDRILKWMAEGKKSTDVTDTLVRTFLLQCWGGYECRYPYALYRGIMDRSFEDDCKTYRNVFF